VIVNDGDDGWCCLLFVCVVVAFVGGVSLCTEQHKSLLMISCFLSGLLLVRLRCVLLVGDVDGGVMLVVVVCLV
jgi:hypothetical protein